MSITDYGWAAPQAPLPEGTEPARVLRAAGRHSFLISESGKYEAVYTGHLLPGDWVAWNAGSHRIEAVLPRRGLLVRKRPGRAAEEQPIAVNIDVVLIVQGLDGDFNLRRLERYLLLAAACEVRAAIVLNKADLLVGHERHRLSTQVERRTGAAVAAVSALSAEGLDQLKELVRPRETAVLLGSSGAGKSTLTNALLGREVQATFAVRADDDRGRHTTSAGELFMVPGGWLLVDTPGLREVEAWAAEDALDTVFGDISELATGCRFRDCRHQGEPGCAVREAAAEGVLDSDRLDHYQKLTRETSAQEVRRQGRIMQRAWRQMQRMRGR